MRPAYSRRGPSLLLLTTLAIGLPIAGVGGTLGVLVAYGQVKLPFWNAPAHDGPPPGMVAAFVTARDIPANTRITRDHVWNAQQQRFSVVYLKPEEVTPEMLIRLEDFVGRVLKRNKPAGYVFNPSDFYPKGTREGIVAGVPPGKRAVVLDASKLSGVHGLRVGDHVDILASQSLDLQKGLGQGRNSSLGGPQAAMLASLKQAATRVLVQDGVIVSPVTTRAKPITSSSLTQGMQSRTVPVEEIVIAVSPAEVSPLYSAAAIESQLTCVARSGQPVEPTAPQNAPPTTSSDESATQDPTPVTAPENRPPAEAAKSFPQDAVQVSHVTPDDDPLERMTLIEGVIGSRKNRGTRRQMLVFPRAGRGPVDLNEPVAEAAGPGT